MSRLSVVVISPSSAAAAFGMVASFFCFEYLVEHAQQRCTEASTKSSRHFLQGTHASGEDVCQRDFVQLNPSSCCQAVLLRVRRLAACRWSVVVAAFAASLASSASCSSPVAAGVGRLCLSFQELWVFAKASPKQFCQTSAKAAVSSV